MVSENGNGHNGKYTAQQYIDAMPGTGGIISAIARKMECGWNTVDRAIKKYPTVAKARDAARSEVTDKAQANLVQAISNGDLAISKWWVQVMDPEFIPKQQLEGFIKSLDLSQLSIKQLERIANGEDPIHVLVTTTS